MSLDVGVGDLLAMKDVADGLAELADSLSAEQAVTLLDAAEEAKAALGNAIAMLKSRAVSQIEQPILVGTTAWAKKPVFKRRPNQRFINAAVSNEALKMAIDEETGVIDPDVAVHGAISLMEALYVSPSTDPKVGGLKLIGITKDEATEEEHTGYELKKVELE